MKYFTDVDRKSEDSLKKAYRKLSMKLHPDRAGGSNKEFQAMQQEYNFCLENIGNSSASYSSSSSSSSRSSRSSSSSSSYARQKAQYEREYENFKRQYGSWEDVFTSHDDYFGEGFPKSRNSPHGSYQRPRQNPNPNWSTAPKFRTNISASDFIKYLEGRSRGIRVAKGNKTYTLDNLNETKYQINPTNGDPYFILETFHSVDLEINLDDMPKNWMYKDEFIVPVFCSEGEKFGTIKITSDNIKFSDDGNAKFTYSSKNIKPKYPEAMNGWISKINKVHSNFDIEEGMSKSTWFGKTIYKIKKMYKSIMD